MTETQKFKSEVEQSNKMNFYIESDSGCQIVHSDSDVKVELLFLSGDRIQFNNLIDDGYEKIKVKVGSCDDALQLLKQYFY